MSRLVSSALFAAVAALAIVPSSANAGCSGCGEVAPVVSSCGGCGETAPVVSYRRVTTRVQVEPARVITRTIPAGFTTVRERVLTSDGCGPCGGSYGYRTVTRTVGTPSVTVVAGVRPARYATVSTLEPVATGTWGFRHRHHHHD
jgi:hypothetical protein